MNRFRGREGGRQTFGDHILDIFSDAWYVFFPIDTALPFLFDFTLGARAHVLFVVVPLFLNNGFLSLLLG